MFPPPMTDTACSGPRPPKTTATLILRCSLTRPPVLVTPSALPGRRAARQQQRGLAHRQALMQDRGDDLGDRHLDAVLAGQLPDRLRGFYARGRLRRGSQNFVQRGAAA